VAQAFCKSVDPEPGHSASVTEPLDFRKPENQYRLGACYRGGSMCGIIQLLPTGGPELIKELRRLESRG
jgi:hypothetical protein